VRGNDTASLGIYLASPIVPNPTCRLLPMTGVVGTALLLAIAIARTKLSLASASNRLTTERFLSSRSRAS